jgi:uncharacterized protein YggE
MFRPLIPLALATATLAVAPAGAQELPSGPKITVLGEGEAMISPDMAIVQLSVLREADTAREAMDANNEAMASVIEALKEQGIEARDLQTRGLSIEPRYVYPENRNGESRPRITGYQVTNGLTVRIRDLAKVGEVLDRSVSLGVNQGGDISFVNDDPKAALSEARRRAVEDAVDKARTLAEAAGVALGDVLEISEHTPRVPPPMPLGAKMMRAEMAADQAVPIEGGENTYTIQVNVTFEIDRQ